MNRSGLRLQHESRVGIRRGVHLQIGIRLRGAKDEHVLQIARKYTDVVLWCIDILCLTDAYRHLSTRPLEKEGFI